MKIDAFLDMMFHSADQTHLWHLQTKSYAVHMALGGYYEGIRCGLDDVAEKCMGFKGIRLQARGGIKVIPFKDVAQIESHLNTIEKFLSDLNDEIMAGNKKATHLVNAIDVIRELISKTKYLLTLG